MWLVLSVVLWRHINMNRHTPPFRLDHGDLTYIQHTHITSLPLLLQINLKGDEDEGHKRHRESWGVCARTRLCVCGGGYWFPDSRTSASECRVSRSPARKNKSQSWSDGCGTLGSGARAIWMAETVYQLHAQQIKFTFGRLPRHRCNRKRPHRPSSLNGFDLSFLGLLCKDDVDPCAVCQHNVTVAIKSHYMQPNGC